MYNYKLQAQPFPFQREGLRTGFNPLPTIYHLAKTKSKNLKSKSLKSKI